jgi:hypothetical protein
MSQGLKSLLWPLALLAAVAGAFAGAASARTDAAPRTTSPPTVEGKFQVGETVTAGQGGWDNSPTSFTYQWQRCSSSGAGCTDITGATARSYKLTSAEVDRTVRVLVTATNTDGSATANSHPSPVISDASAPRNSVRPTISGTARVGETLTVSRGTWTGGVTAYAYQWQHCDELGNACTDVAGATSQTYNVRSADVGGTLRAVVTARNAAGRTSVNTDRSAVVTEAGGGGTTTVVTTVQGNKAPTITFQSLKVRSNRVYVRFRVCDDSFGRVRITARDQMARRLAYTRRLSVTPSPCGTYSRTWSLIPRFRAHGKFVVTLRASDSSGRLSRLVSRSVRL